MKHIYNTLILSILFSFGALSQSPVITMISDGDCSGGTPKVVEVFADGTVDFSLYSLEIQSNGNTTWGSAQNLGEFGIVTNEFAYIYGSSGEESFISEYPSIAGGSSLIIAAGGAVNFNGDDRIRIIEDATGNVIDQFGEEGVDGSGQAWEYLDGFAKRLTLTTPNGTFNEAHWEYNKSALNNLGTCQSGPEPYETIIGIGTYEPQTCEDLVVTYDDVSHCSGATSTLSGTVSAPSSTLLSEEFDDLSNWTAVDVGSGDWGVGSPTYYSPYSGSSCAHINGGYVGATDYIEYTLASATSMSMTYYYICQSWSGDADVLDVEYYDGSSWVSLASFSNVSTWTSATHSIPDGATKIRFRASINYGYGIAVDQLVITGAPADTYTYSWSPSTGLDDATSASPVASNSTTQTYTVTATSSAGCTGTADVVATVDSPVAGTLTGTQSIAPGETTTITSDGTTGGEWTSSDASVATVDASGVVSGVFAGTADITYAVGGTTCPDASSITVTVACAADLVVTYDDVEHCEGNSSTLSGTVSDPNETATIYITTSGGSYPGEKYVIITTGENNTGTTVYNQGGYGFLTGVAVDVSAYIGQTLYFNAYDGWGDGWDGTSYAVTDGGSTTWLSGTNPNNGTGGGGNAEVEASVPFTVTSSQTYTYAWTPTTDLDDATSASPVASNSTIETYTVTATSSAGCTGTADVVATVSSPTAGTLTGTQTIAPGGTTTISSDGTTGGEWSSSDESVATVDASGVVSGVFAGTADITYAVGGTTCPDASSITVTVACAADLVVTYDDVEHCEGNSSTLSGTVSDPSESYTYTFNGVDSYGDSWNGSTVTINVDGVAVVQDWENENLDGFFNTEETQTVTFSAGVGSEITLSWETGTYTSEVSWSIVGPDNTTLSSGGHGATAGGTTSYSNASYTYAWTPSTDLDDATSASPVASNSTTQTYTVTATSSAGCTGTADVVATVDSPVAGTLTGTQSIAPGETTAITSDGTTGGEWTSSDASVATVDASGVVSGVFAGTADITYAVGGTTCPDASTITITVACAADLVVTYDDVEHCEGNSSTLSGTVSDPNETATIYITTSGGSYPGEKYVIITTGENNTGTTVYDQGGYGFLTGVAVDVSAYIGQTLYFNAYDGWGDGWDGTSYAVTDGGSTTWLSGTNPSNGTGGGGNAEVEASVPFTVTSSQTYTYAWTPTTDLDDATSASPVASNSTIETYTVTATSSAGCTGTADVVVTVSSPTAGTLTGTQTIAPGGTTTIISDGTTGGEWTSSDDAVATVDASTGVVSGVFAGTADITYAVGGTTCPDAASITVTVACAADLVVTYDDVEHCEGNSSTLSGTVSDPSESYTYTFNGVDSYGDSWNGSTVTINVDGVAVVQDWGNENLDGFFNTEETQTVTFSAGVGSEITLSWETGTYTSEVSWSIVGPDNTTLSSGGHGATAGGTTSYSNASYTYAWTPSTDLDDATSASPVASNSTTQTYTVTATSSAGCTGTADVVATVDSPVAGTLTGTQSIAPGETTAITSDGTTGGEWTSSDASVATVDASGVVSGVFAGTADITYAVGGTTCPDASTITITVACAADLVVTYDDVEHCEGNSSTLSGTVSDPNETATIYITTSGGSYPGEKYVIITTGENNTGTTVYDQGGYGFLTDVAVDVSAYIGQTLYFNAYDGWGDGWDGTSYAVTDGGSTTWLSGTNPNNGTGGGGNAEVEASVPFTVTSSQTYTYAWTPTTDLDDATSASPVASNSTIETYTVTATSSAGCTGTADVVATVSSPTAGTLTGTQTIAPGGTTTISSDGTTGGEWSSSDESVATVDASGVVSGVFAGTADITYAVGGTTCPDASSITVTVACAADLVVTYDDVEHCEGNSSTLSGTVSDPSESYTYTFNGVDSYGDSWNGSTVTINVDGVAVVQDWENENLDGFFNTEETQTVTFSAGVGSEITLSWETGTYTSEVSWSIVGPDNTTLSSGGHGATAGGTTSYSNASYTYAWTPSTDLDDATSASPVASNSTTQTYTVTATSSAGCTGTADVVATVDSPVAGTLTGTQSIAPGETTAITSDGTTGGEWTSSDASVATVDASGVVSGVFAGTADITYAVGGTTCPDASTITITVACAADLVVTYDDVLHCAGNTSTLSGTVVDGQSSTLLSEEFDDFSNWNVVEVSGPGDWATGSPNYFAPYSGSSCAHIYAGSYTPTTDYIEYTLPSATSISMSYYYICEDWSGDADVLDVEYYDGSAWVSLATYNSVASWTSATHSIPDGATKVRFRATLGYGYGIGLDQVSITGTASGTYTYSWSPSTGLDDATSASPVASNSTTQTYTVTATSSAGCTGTADVVATVDSPVAGTLTGTQSIAPGETTAITSDGTTGGEWTSSDASVATVDASGVVSGVFAGTADITYTVGGTECPDASTITITVACAADLVVTYDDVEHCEGNSSTLSGTVSDPNETATIYITTSGGSYPGEKYVIITTGENNTGTTVYDQGGYGLLTDVAVDVSAYIGQTLYFNAYDGWGDGWDGTSYAVTDGGSTTWLSGTNPNNGTGGGGNAEVEASVPFTVTSSQTYTYAWTPTTDLDDATSASPVASNSTIETYTVTATSSAGCTGTADVVATVSNPTAGTLTGTQTIAPGGTTTISSDGTTGGEWSSSDESVATVDASGVVSGVFAGTADITYAVGGTTCPDASSITVTVACAADLVVTYDDVEHCEGNSSTLSGTVSDPSESYTYTFNGVDSYGDSWNGSTVTINVDGVAVVQDWENENLDGFFNTEETQTVTFSAGVGSEITLSWETGTYTSEVSWSIVGPDNTTLSSGGHGATAGGTTSYSNASYTYAWTPSTDLDDATSASPVASNSTIETYTVTATNALGCTGTADVVVTVSSPTAGTLTGTQTIAPGGTTTIISDGTTGGEWTSSDDAVATVDASTGVVSGVFAGTADITYAVGGTTCPDASTITITVACAADLVVTYDDVLHCAGNTSTLSGTVVDGQSSTLLSEEFDDFSNWNVVEVSGPGDWATGSPNYFAPYSGSSCAHIYAGSYTPTTDYIEYTLPSATSISMSYYYICEDWSGDADVLDVEYYDGSAWVSLATYNSVASWTSATHSIPDGATKVRFRATLGYGYGIGLDQVSITGTASGTYTYSWSPSTGLDDATSASPVASNSTTQTYTVTATSSAGCTGTADVVATVDSPVAGTLTGTQSIAPGETTAITSDGTTGGEWTSSDASVATVDASGVVSGVFAGTADITYTVGGTECPDASTITITVACAADLVVTYDDVEHCEGNSSTLSGTVSDPNETATIYITTSGGSYPGEKYVIITTGENNTGTTVYDQGGYGLLTDVAVDVSAYIGQTLYFNAYDGWGDGWDGTSYAVTDGGSTTWLSGTNPNNGTGGGGNAEVEASVPFTVTSSQTYTYAWTPTTDLDDATSASPVASNSTIETYTITVTSSLGCTGTDDVIATVSNPSAGTLSGTTTIAPEGTTTISSDGTTGGIWESDDTAVATVDASTGVVTGGIAGSATITYTVGGTACPDASTITVNVVCDVYTVVYDDVTFCDGTPTTLSQTSNSQNNTYEFYGLDQYSDGWNGASVDISVNGVTVLTGVAVVVSGESWFFDAPNGATIDLAWTSGAWDGEISWGIYAPDGVTLLDNGIYGTASSTIPGSAPSYTYSWSPSTGLDDASIMEPTSSASTTTVYTVTVTDGFGCVATDDVTATVNPLYTPTVTIVSSDADNEICSGDAVTFTATAVDAGNPTYVWNIGGSPVSGETASTFTTTTLVNADEVTVTVTADNTCQTVNEVTSTGITTTVNAVTAGTIEASVDGATTYASTPQVIQVGNDIYWEYTAGSATGTFSSFEFQWQGTTNTWNENFGGGANPYNWGAGQTLNPGQTLYVRAKAACGSNAAYSDPVAVDWLTCYGGTTEIATSTSDGGSIVDGGNMTVNSTISWTAPTDAFGDAYHWEYSWDGGSSFNGEWQNNTNPATWSDNIGSQADNTLTIRYVSTGSSSCSDNATADFDVTVLRPVITVSAISGDLAVCSDGDASSSETFTVEGLYIANDDNAPAAAASHTGILVSAPAGLEISTDNSTFSSTINLSANNGTVSNTTIYARIIAGQSASDVSGDIVCTAQAATTQNVSAVATIDENAEIETSVSFTGTTTCGEVSIDVQVNGVSAGSGSWTALSGLFLSATDVATTFTTSTFGSTITLTWTSSNGACTGETTSMDVEFNQPTTATIDGYGMDTESWIWGGLTDDDWSEPSNWYAYTTDLDNNSYWERQTVNVPSATDKVYIMANSDAGQCVSSSNSAITTPGAAVTDLMVANGATLNLSGATSIKGDLTNDGTINAGSSTLTFDGTSDQTVSGNALTLDNLTVNKTSGNLTVSTPINVNGLLDLSSDVNNGTNILSVGTSSASTGSIEQNGGIVLGKLRRYFANASGSKSFPVGIAGTMRDVAVDFVSAPGTDQYITASYNTGYPQASDGSDLYEGLPLTTSDNQLIQNYDDEGYWELIPGSSSTGDSYIAPINGEQYNVTLHCNNLTGADNVTNMDRTKVRMIKSAGPGHTFWEALTHVSISGDDADFLLTASGTGFSFFGAGTEDDNALPVELVSFSGDCNDGVVDLIWQTASEQSSEDFEIEYSRDGVVWSLIHTEPAAGFSNELITYNFLHKQAISGNNYYRLTQNDIDGTAMIYNNLIINANCQSTSDGYFSVFPNPSSGNFQVIMNNPEIEGTAQLRIVDTKGNEVFMKSIEVNSGINMFVIQQDLAPGIYYINIENSSRTTNVVKHSIR